MKNQYRSVMVLIAAATLVWFWGACGSSSVSGPTVTLTSIDGKTFVTSPVSVTFSTAMDQASVESAFSIAGSDPVAGTFAWADNTVTFTPAALWVTNHLYTLTITTEAKDAAGAPLAENYTQQFAPRINMHDVNGDGIDDFIVSSPFHDYDPATPNAGAAYLFLGKAGMTDVDLATQKADATITASFSMGLAYDARIVGDINGDGYADIMMSNPSANLPTGNGRGFVILVYGSETPVDITYSETDLSAFIGVTGPADDTGLGWPIVPVGDVNGDSLADVVFAGKLPPNDTQFWLVLGQTDPWPTLETFPPVTDISDATYSVTGDLIYGGMAGYPSAGCDVNGDELSDMIFGSPESAGGGTSRGQVYVVAGSATPVSIDLRTEAASETITGAADDSFFGGQVACGDVNGDGYGDLYIGAPRMDSNKGRSYLIAGGSTFADLNLGTHSATAIYTGALALDMLGSFAAIPGDVNGDGYDDMFVSSPFMTVDGTQFRGRGYLFLGSATPASVDLSAGGMADAMYTGAVPAAGDPYLLGYCKPVGDVNGDGIDDILLNAPFAPVGGSEQGQAFVSYGAVAGPPSIDFTSETADVTITGAAANDWLLIVPSAL